MEKKTLGKRGGRGTSWSGKDVCETLGMWTLVWIIEWIWNKKRQTLVSGYESMCLGMSEETFHSKLSFFNTTVVPIALYKDCAIPIAFVLIEQRSTS